MSDPAIASEEGAQQLTPAERNGAAALNGNGTVDISQETVLRPVPHPAPERSPLRRWTSHGLLVDVAMLFAANVLFLLDDAGSGYGVPLLLVFDVIVVALVVSWHGYAKRLRLDALADLRVTFTSTAVATMTIVAIDALRSADEPSAYAALRIWLLATVLLAVGRLATNLVVAWSRSRTRATRRPGKERSTSMATHSRVKSSTMLSVRKARPSARVSSVKSIDQRSRR